ncbi:MAG: response regulator [Chitinispirillaceae bacterium]
MSENLEIMIVDDENQITDLLKSFISLHAPDAIVHAFNDPGEAMSYLQSNHLDLVITDYQMPCINGLTLLESAHPDVTKVLISGYVSQIAEEKLSKLNAVFFEKPIKFLELGKIIDNCQKNTAELRNDFH